MQLNTIPSPLPSQKNPSSPLPLPYMPYIRNFVLWSSFSTSQDGPIFYPLHYTPELRFTIADFIRANRIFPGPFALWLSEENRWGYGSIHRYGWIFFDGFYFQNPQTLWRWHMGKYPVNFYDGLDSFFIPHKTEKWQSLKSIFEEEQPFSFWNPEPRDIVITPDKKVMRLIMKSPVCWLALNYIDEIRNVPYKKRKRYYVYSSSMRDFAVIREKYPELLDQIVQREKEADE